MKRLSLAALAGAAVASIAFAAPAFAAYNDVTFQPSVSSFTVNGVSLTIIDQSNVIESAQVTDAGTLVISAPSGSSFELIAPAGNVLSTDQASSLPGLSVVCSQSLSRLVYTSATTTTVTVTPSTTQFCPVGSGGGGGGGTSSGTTSSPAGSPTTTTSAVTTPSASQTIQDQIASLLAQIAALQAAQGTSASAASGTISRTLKSGSSGADVKALQAYLNAHGYVVAKSGPGSAGLETSIFGPATKAAVMALQKAAGISPVSGLVGPRTRAYIAAHP